MKRLLVHRYFRRSFLIILIGFHIIFSYRQFEKVIPPSHSLGFAIFLFGLSLWYVAAYYLGRIDATEISYLYLEKINSNWEEETRLLTEQSELLGARRKFLTEQSELLQTKKTLLTEQSELLQTKKTLLTEKSQLLETKDSLIIQLEDGQEEYISELSRAVNNSVNVVNDFQVLVYDLMERNNQLLELLEEKSRLPWQKSRPRKQGRDEIIWTMRQEGHTWEDIAERAGCGVSTAKEAYERMKKTG